MGSIILWVLIAIGALVIDIITSTFFFAGFTIGGIFALIAQLGGSPFIVQVIVFAVVSAVAVAVEFIWFRKKVRKSIPKTLKMEEKYIGRVITVDEDIEDRGRIKIQGIYWTIENEDDKPIKKGQKAKIIGVRGNKITITKF